MGSTIAGSRSRAARELTRTVPALAHGPDGRDGSQLGALRSSRSVGISCRCWRGKCVRGPPAVLAGRKTRQGICGGRPCARPRGCRTFTGEDTERMCRSPSTTLVDPRIWARARGCIRCRVRHEKTPVAATSHIRAETGGDRERGGAAPHSTLGWGVALVGALPLA